MRKIYFVVRKRFARFSRFGRLIPVHEEAPVLDRDDLLKRALDSRNTRRRVDPLRQLAEEKRAVLYLAEKFRPPPCFVFLFGESEEESERENWPREKKKKIEKIKNAPIDRQLVQERDLLRIWAVAPRPQLDIGPGTLEVRVDLDGRPRLCDASERDEGEHVVALVSKSEQLARKRGVAVFGLLRDDLDLEIDERERPRLEQDVHDWTHQTVTPSEAANARCIRWRSPGVELDEVSRRIDISQASNQRIQMPFSHS